LEGKPPPREDKEWQAAIKNLRDTAGRLIELTPDVPDQARHVILNIEDPGLLADLLASNLTVDVSEKQDLLEELDVVKRVRQVQLRLSAQLEIAELQQKLQQDVASHISDT